MRTIAALLAASTAALAVARIIGKLPVSFGRRTPRNSRQSALAGALQQSGVSMSAQRFHAASLGCGLAAFVAVHGLSGVGMVAIGPAALATLAPRWWIARRAARRHEEVQRAWPDAIRDIVAAIGAGVSLHHALEGLADSGPAALRPVFSRFTVAARSVGVAPALESVRDELADATSDRIIEILLVAHERGGPIVPEILRDLATATTKDIWVLEQVRTESLEQRINARAVFALPWLVLIAITLQDGPFRDFYRSTAGFVVIAIGGAASALGMVLVRRLGSQPSEPRVLGRVR